MFKLVEKIQALIEAYHAINDTIESDTKAIIQEWTAKIETHKLEYIKLQIREGIKDVTTSAEKTNKVLNQKLKAVLSEARNQLFPGIAKDAKTVDYAARVNNALQFLRIEGDTITDESAYMILKDFVDDVDQMRLFRNVIEKYVDLHDHEGKTVFPNTFGKLNKVEFLHNHFVELESIANMLFIHPKSTGQMFIVNGERYSTVIESYEQTVGEGTIIQLAEEIEKNANEIFGVGRIENQTEHKTAENDEVVE